MRSVHLAHSPLLAQLFFGGVSSAIGRGTGVLMVKLVEASTTNKVRLVRMSMKQGGFPYDIVQSLVVSGGGGDHIGTNDAGARQRIYLVLIHSTTVTMLHLGSHVRLRCRSDPCGLCDGKKLRETAATAVDLHTKCTRQTASPDGAVTRSTLATLNSQCPVLGW